MKNPIVVQYFYYDIIMLRMAYNTLTEAGITAVIEDELATQTLQLDSRAIGGAKILVDESDYERASQILLDIGIMKESNSRRDFEPIYQFKKKTERLPLIGHLDSDLRLTIIFGLIITVGFLGAVLFLLW
jgi:hypothetical protein